MLRRLVDVILGPRKKNAYFIRSVVIQSNRGPLQLWLLQPYSRRKVIPRKRMEGVPFWELQNTVQNPFFGRSSEENPITALSAILKENELKFMFRIELNTTSHSVEFF